LTWIKVCGVRHPRDVEAAVAAGADAIGLVIATGSPRWVPLEEAKRLGESVTLIKVLVTRDMAPEEVLASALAAEVDGVQPHGRMAASSAARAREAGLVVLHPIPVSGSVDLGVVPDDQIPLLDGVNPGSGTPFDWGLAAPLQRPFVLSGGLNPGNVAAAMARVRPWGVDASSGLETVPGVKDPDLIQRFVAAVRSI
jgi:phosphoribosylanthranilate isomerase